MLAAMSTNDNTPAAPLVDRYGFPLRVCPRCGGTGHYSYNQVTGTICFKCNGGKYFHKDARTEKARAAFDAACFAAQATRADAVQAGRKVWVESYRRWLTVTASAVSDTTCNGVPMWCLTVGKGWSMPVHLTMAADTLVRVQQPKERMPDPAPFVAQALGQT